MPKVSVLMPNYNTKGEFLRESVESILNQTFTDFELIIVDDGSREDIQPILDSYNDVRIKFYKNEENFGVSKTRNRLLNLAQGEYVAFQDSDDISLTERLAKQVEFLDENPEYSAVGSWLETFPNGRVIEYIKNPRILDFVGGCVFSQGTSMLRLSDFKKYNLKYNEKYSTSEDYDLWSRAIGVLKFSTIPEVLLKYRKNNESLVHSKKTAIETADIEIKKNLLNMLTMDTKLQEKIVKITTQYYRKKLSFKEWLFSVRNVWSGLNKTKVVTIFGVSIILK